MSGHDDSQRLQQISEQLQGLEELRAELDAKIDELRERRDTLATATDTVDELEAGEEILVPVAEGVRVRATVASVDDLIVGVGSGYAAELDADGAADVIESKRETLADQIEELEDDLETTEEEIGQLEREAQRIQQEMQTGGMGDGLPDA